MAFSIVDPKLGTQSLASTDATQNHPLGTRIKAVDSTYGEGEFIYLKGVASTVVGSAVVWDSSFQTTLTVAASRGPVGISMSANVASQYGWYQISGIAQAYAAGAVASGAPLQTSATGGAIDDTTTAGQYIDGAVSKGTASGAASLFSVGLAHPCCNGR